MPNEKEFSDLYLSRTTVVELARKYFVSTNVIAGWVRVFGLSKVGKYLKKEDIEKVLRKKTTHIKMAKELNCSGPTLTSYLIKFGLKENKPDYLIDIKEMYELRVNSKWSFGELAELYETSNQMIQNRCKQNGFPKVKVIKQKNLWQN